MFKKIYFNNSFAEALAHMPKFSKMVKDLLTNKEKLLELANTPLNENCSAVLLKKLPEKLRDTKRSLIPCDFYGLESCMALADLGASINLMPLSMWKTLSSPELYPTRMALELATRTVAYPAGIADDVFVQVGKFTFLADFVVIDYDVDPRVPLILGRPFLRTEHSLVDVHDEELILRVGDEKYVFNVESTSKYPRKHGDESIHKIDILDITCEDHFHEEINTFLASDDSTSPNDNDGTFNMEGDIHLIKLLLNNDISNDLPHPLPMYDINKTEKIKTLIDDPLDIELKDLHPHLEYAFLEGTSKLLVIIAKDLKREEKEQLLKKLTKAPIHVSRDWDLPFELMCDASDFAVGAVLGQIKDKYFRPIHYASKTLSDAQTHYTTTEKELLAAVKRNSLRMLDIILGMTPISLGFVLIRLFSGVWTGMKLWIFSKLAIMVPPGGIMARTTPPRKFLTLDFSGPPYIAMPMTLSHSMTYVSVREKSYRGTKCPKIMFRFMRSLTSGALTLWARSRLREGTDIYSWLSTMSLNGLK
nr:reverse transcriptase domain-containing protein [Tanacetum cinerariifolium]